jgi:hypothetical protein
LRYGKTVKLEKGKAYPILVRFFEGGGAAAMRLMWRRRGDPLLSVVPASALHGAQERSEPETFDSIFA